MQGPIEWRTFKAKLQKKPHTRKQGKQTERRQPGGAHAPGLFSSFVFGVDMKNIAAQLEFYCKEHPIRLDDRETILESIYWLYAESAPTDSEKLRDGYARLREQLHFLIDCLEALG